MVDGINSIEDLSCINPKGAFYVFMNVTKTGLTSDEFATRLLKETGVVLVSGTGFGDAGEGFVRLSYATSEENIEEGLRRIKSFVCSLK
jgi:aminotransferase